jgi:YegS/Rv2252/BmrU family lipid kinase
LSRKTNNFSTDNHSNNLPLIVVNPTSAGGSTETLWAKAASDFAAHFGAFNVKFTKAVGDGQRIALEAAQAGRKFIIACGGDGTINEVANGIIESGADAELGILPNGTGGDFRRTFDIPTFSAKAARYLKSGVTKTIDAGRATFTNHAGEEISRYFLGIASFGLSTSVINRVKKDKSFNWLPMRKLAGQATFAWSTLLTTLDMQYTKAKVKIDDGRPRELSVVNFCVANARYFGGGMKIAPDAKLDDGLFDIVMIGEISAAKILSNSYKLYNGTHFDVSGVHHTHAKQVEISPLHDEKTGFELDGELPGLLPLKLEIVPNALKIRVPKSTTK